MWLHLKIYCNNAEIFNSSILENRDSLDDVNIIYLTVFRNEVWSLVVTSDKSIYFVDGTMIYEMPDISEYMRSLKIKYISSC